jgi:hypothetical protein
LNPKLFLNVELWEAAALAFSGVNLAARGYQTFDTLFITG